MALLVKCNRSIYYTRKWYNGLSTVMPGGYVMADREMGWAELFTSLVEESLLGVYIIQGDRFLYVNPRCAEIFGYGVDEMVREKRVSELVHPEDRKTVADNVARRISGEVRSVHYRFRGLRKDGESLEVEVYGSSTKFRGEPAVIGTLVDITEKSRVEQEKETVRIVSQMLLDADSLEEVFASVPGVLAERFRYPAAAVELYDEASDEMELVGSAGIPAQAGALVRVPASRTLSGCVATSGKAVRAMDAEARAGAGDYALKALGARTYLCVPMRSRGRVLGTLALADPAPRSDVHSDEYALQIIADLMAQTIARRRAEEDRTAFFNMITHDIKGPLTVMSGYSELLAGTCTDERSLPMLEEMSKAVQRITALIEDMLALSRYEAGRQELAPSRFPLDEVIRQAVKDNEVPASAAGVEVRMEAPEPVPEVDADKGQLARAVCNLVANAVNYNRPGGSVTVRAGLAAGDSGTAFVEVSDNGIGIAAEDLPHVFEKYYRGRGAGRSKGTGLGLAIVRAVVEAHRGSVTVASREGEGTAFTVYLPAARREKA